MTCKPTCEELEKRIQKLESELKEAQQERFCLATVIEQSTECVILTDAEKNICYVNEAFKKQSGYYETEVMGKPVTVFVNEKTGSQFCTEIRNSLDIKGVWSGRLEVKTKKGIFEIDLRISPVRDESGSAVNYVYFARDVTRQARMKRRLSRAKKMEAIGTLAGGVAHDFNNILGAVNIYVGGAWTLLPENSPAKKKLDKALRVIDSAKGLIEQIMAFSRLSDGEKQALFFAKIIRNAVKLVEDSAPSNIRISVHIETKSDIISGDPTQLNQVVSNLLNNAVYAVGEKQGKIEIVLSDAFFVEAVESDQVSIDSGDYILLTVRDTGVGMTEEVMNHIFEPFFTTRRSEKGAGLGLAVVQSIVIAHGGIIMVDSECGNGSEFQIYFPKKN